ncbi:hypothetical protein [Mycobacteroides abscessus]|uniref:hypothetical protein n=1 Tax=Mycobacteroides abscessus TaxID=36809 RepID=UPI0010424A1C|nr:hypothetical protein [Mycobacteroides abscessus]
MRTNLDKLDDTLGVKRAFDPQLAQELKEQHREDQDIIKRLRAEFLRVFPDHWSPHHGNIRHLACRHAF